MLTNCIPILKTYLYISTWAIWSELNSCNRRQRGNELYTISLIRCRRHRSESLIISSACLEIVGGVGRQRRERRRYERRGRHRRGRGERGRYRARRRFGHFGPKRLISRRVRYRRYWCCFIVSVIDRLWWRLRLRRRTAKSIGEWGFPFNTRNMLLLLLLLLMVMI